MRSAREFFFIRKSNQSDLVAIWNYKVNEVGGKIKTFIKKKIRKRKNFDFETFFRGRKREKILSGF